MAHYKEPLSGRSPRLRSQATNEDRDHAIYLDALHINPPATGAVRLTAATPAFAERVEFTHQVFGLV